MINNIFYFFSSFLTPLFSFIFIGMVSRNVPVETFSNLSLSLVIISYCQIFTDFGSKDFFLTNESKRIFDETFFINVIKINFICVIVFFFVIYLLDNNLGLITFSLVFEFLVTSILLKLILLKLQLIDTTQKYKFYNIVFAFSVPGVKCLIFYFTNNIIYSFLFSGMLGLVLILILATINGLLSRKDFFVFSIANYLKYIKNWKYWYPFLLSTLSFFLYFNSDKLIIAWKLSNEDLAIYTISTTIMSVGEMVCTIVWTLLISKMNIISTNFRYRVFLRRLSFFGALLFSILVFSLGDKLIAIFFGHNYIMAYKISCILSLYFFFRYWNIISELILLDNGRSKYLANARLSCGIFNIVINLIFINMFGIIVAAISTILSEFILMLILNHENKK